MTKKEVHHTTIKSLIDWLDYKRLTGHQAARYEPAQEEYWAKLVRDLQEIAESRRLHLEQLQSRVKYLEEVIEGSELKAIISA